MVDEVVDTNPSADTPIFIPKTPYASQIATFVRDFGVVITAVPSFVAILGTHDTVKICAFLGSETFAPVIGVVALVGILGWRQFLARKQHSNDVKLGNNVDDKVAVVQK